MREIRPSARKTYSPEPAGCRRGSGYGKKKHIRTYTHGEGDTASLENIRAYALGRSDDVIVARELYKKKRGKKEKKARSEAA